MRLLNALLCFCVCTAYAQSAGSMVSACKQIATAKANDRVTLLPQSFDAGLCWGAFGVLEQLTKLSGTTKRATTTPAAICIPEDTPRFRLIAAFTEFMKRHPNRNEENFYPVARESLRSAFPCQAEPARGKL